jgi:hypothetical protein
VITARCDAAHDKVPIYNYLPIIPLSNWLLVDGSDIAARRGCASAMDQMRDSLRSVQLSDTALEYVPLETIEQNLLADVSADVKRAGERFRKAKEKLKISEAVIGSINVQAIKLFYKENQSLFRRLLKELLGNGITDFHYLPRIERGAAATGFVVSLREVRHISARTAERIAQGVDPAGLSDDPDAAQLQSELAFNQHCDYALPISQVASPFNELILQRFSMVFGRIGVEDLTGADIDAASRTFAELLE